PSWCCPTTRPQSRRSLKPPVSTRCMEPVTDWVAPQKVTIGTEEVGDASMVMVHSSVAGQELHLGKSRQAGVQDGRGPRHSLGPRPLVLRRRSSEIGVKVQ